MIPPTLTGMVQTDRRTAAGAGERVETLAILSGAGGNVKWCSWLRNRMDGPHGVRRRAAL